MVQKREGDICPYHFIVDVPELTFHEGHCCKIKLYSDRITTRNSIHVHHTPIPAKTFLTDTDKKAELKLNPIPIPEPIYRSVSPNSTNSPN